MYSDERSIRQTPKLFADYVLGKKMNGVKLMSFLRSEENIRDFVKKHKNEIPERYLLSYVRYVKSELGKHIIKKNMP